MKWLESMRLPRLAGISAAGASLAMVLGFFASSARGQAVLPVLDQRTCDEVPVGYARIDAGTWKAQTFVAGVDGRLAFVRLPSIRFGPPGLTTLHLRPTDSCDGPLATAGALTCDVPGRGKTSWRRSRSRRDRLSRLGGS